MMSTCAPTARSGDFEEGFAATAADIAQADADREENRLRRVRKALYQGTPGHVDSALRNVWPWLEAKVGGGGRCKLDPRLKGSSTPRFQKE